MQKIISKKNFFLDSCIWIGFNNLPVLRREYLSSAVNVVRNSRKNLRITKSSVFQLSFLQRN